MTIGAAVTGAAPEGGEQIQVGGERRPRIRTRDRAMSTGAARRTTRAGRADTRGTTRAGDSHTYRQRASWAMRTEAISMRSYECECECVNVSVCVCV